MTELVKLFVFVPLTHTEAVRKALGDAGAGHIGAYTHCSFSVLGKGRYRSGDSSKPFIGAAGEFAEVEEEKIEWVCERGRMPTILAALRQAHPYEEIAFDVIPVEHWPL